MTLDELDRFFINNKIKITMFGNSMYQGRWYVTAEKNDDDVAVKVTQTGDDLYECMLIVAEKFKKIVHTGVPNLLAPQIEYRKADLEIVEVNSTARPSVDDDFPF